MNFTGRPEFSARNSGSRHILVINQHGENRGDEAALRAMISGFEHQIGPGRYTVIAQFRDPNLVIPFDEDVTFHNLRMPIAEFIGLVLFSFLQIIGIRMKRLLSTRTTAIIEAFESADLVVSAPGGPYFGDLYADHEIVHWYYVWLASRHHKKLLLYAPSAGPFRHLLLNPIRRCLFKTFDVLCVREAISQRMLHNFLGQRTIIHVTGDSAIQQIVPAIARADYFADHRSGLRGRFLVAVSVIEYAFPGVPDPKSAQTQYRQCLISALDFLAQEKHCHFLLLPQLYGAVHSDVPFLKSFCHLIPSSASWEIVDPDLSSTEQRAVFGMADICIASRYHPQIFAATANVPGVCIYYEHKALGFMQALNMESLAFDIRKLDSRALLQGLARVLRERQQLSQILAERIPELRKRSAQTTELAIDLLRRPI